MLTPFQEERKFFNTLFNSFPETVKINRKWNSMMLFVDDAIASGKRFEITVRRECYHSHLTPDEVEANIIYCSISLSPFSRGCHKLMDCALSSTHRYFWLSVYSLLLTSVSYLVLSRFISFLLFSSARFFSTSKYCTLNEWKK